MDADDVLLQRNVDPKEIKSFSPMAADWWNAKDGPAYPSHDMNKMRIDLICEGLISTGVMKPWQKDQPNALEGIKVLEIGCGGGIVAEALAKLKATITGLDPNEALLSVAKEHIAPQDDIKGYVTYLDETIEDHCKRFPNHYDVIVCSEVLEHVIDKKSLLEAGCKALKPGGSIFLTTFNKTFFSWFFAIVWGEYILGILPRGCHQYELFISPHDVSKILAESNCRTNILRGDFYNFIGRSYWVHRWLGFHWIMHAVKNNE